MLPRGKTPITIFPTTDALARWWADKRMLTLSVDGVDGSHRALELLFVQRRDLQPLAQVFRRNVKNWCQRTGRPNPMEGRVQFTTFWVTWLADRGLMVGDVVPASVAARLREEAEEVSAPFIRAGMVPGQQLWRRRSEISKRHRALALLRLPNGKVLVDVVATRTSSERKKAKQRVQGTAWRARNGERMREKAVAKQREAFAKVPVVGQRERARRSKADGRAVLLREVDGVTWQAIA
jgi:hypothetical protein